MPDLSSYSDEQLKALYNAVPSVEPSLSNYSDDELKKLYQQQQDNDAAGTGENIAKMLPDFATRGALKALQEGELVKAGVGKNQEDVAKDIARYQRGINAAAMDPEQQASMESISNSRGWIDAAKNIGKVAVTNPSALGSTVGEGVVSTIPTLGAFAVGSAGTPLTGAVVAGGAAASQGYADAKLQFLQKNGVDLADDKQLKAALSNPELMQKADDYARKIGGIAGITQAVSGPLAGKFIAEAEPGIANLATAGTKEAATQGGLQAAGTAASGYATEGKVNPADVVTSGALGAVSALPEVLIGAKARGRSPEAEPILAPERLPESIPEEKLALPAPSPEELRLGNPDAMIINPEGVAMQARPTDTGERYYAPDNTVAKTQPPLDNSLSEAPKAQDNKAQEAKMAALEIQYDKLPASSPKRPKILNQMNELADQAIHNFSNPDAEPVKALSPEKPLDRPTKATSPLADRLEAIAVDRAAAGYPEEAASYRAKAEQLRSPSAPTERFAAVQPEIHPKIIAALKQMNPGLKVEAANEIFGSGDNIKRSGAMSDKEQPVAGGYDALKNIAYVSLNSPDPMDAAFHEGWHSLERHFSEPDRKLLLDAFPAQGNINHSERTAMAYANWANKPASAPLSVRPVFSRIKNTLSKIGNSLRGKGFNSVEDIFQRAKSGEVAKEAGIKPLSESTPEEAAKSLDNIKYSFANDPVSSISQATGLNESQSKSWLQQQSEMRKYMGATSLGKTLEGKTIRALPSDLRHMALSVSEWNSKWLGSVRGYLNVLHDKTGSPTIAKIRDLIAREPGSGRATAEPYQDEAIRLAETARYKTNRELKQYLNNPKAMEAVRFLVNNREKINLKSGSALDRSAQTIADTLDSFPKEMKDAGMEVGFVKNYFPQGYDTSKIIENSDKFIPQAAKAFKTQAIEDGKPITDAQAMEAAQAWLYGAERNDDQASIGGMVGGTPSFVKSRTFGDKARAHLDDFLIKDPISALNNYYDKASTLIAHEKRFSTDKLKDYDEAMQAEGISALDRKKVFTAIKSVSGKLGNDVGGWRGFLNGAQYINSLITLPRVAYASIMEPITASVHTGNIKDSFSSMYHTMKFLFSKSEDTKALRDSIGMISGVVHDMGTEMMMASRYDLLGSSSGKVARRMNRFFEQTGISKLTDAQRLSSAVIFQNYMYRLSKAHKEGSRWAAEELQDHGIPADKVDAFSDYIARHKEAGISLDEKQADLNKLYASGMHTFVDRSIQHTKRAERPLYANSPVGRLFYALQGFNNGFTQNVLLRSARMAKRGIKGDGYSLADRMRLMAPAAMLTTVFAASQAALLEAKKAVYFNPDQSDKKKDGMLAAYQFLNTSNLAGNYGMLMNTILSIKYGNSPQAALSGPLMGNYGNAFAASVRLATNNSKNTNTAERTFAKEFYDTLVQPALINTVVTSVPGSLVPFTLIQGIAHPATRAAFVGATAGKKKSKE